MWLSVYTYVTKVYVKTEAEPSEGLAVDEGKKVPGTTPIVALPLTVEQMNVYGGDTNSRYVLILMHRVLSKTLGWCYYYQPYLGETVGRESLEP